eukprot:767283-Hanusia_phi.AAC.5
MVRVKGGTGKPLLRRSEGFGGVTTHRSRGYAMRQSSERALRRVRQNSSSNGLYIHLIQESHTARGTESTDQLREDVEGKPSPANAVRSSTGRHAEPLGGGGTRAKIPASDGQRSGKLALVPCQSDRDGWVEMGPRYLRKG